MNPIILNGEKGKAKVTIKAGAELVNVVYSYWNAAAKVSIDFPIDNIDFGEEDHTITMKHNDHGVHVFTCLRNDTFKAIESTVEKLRRDKGSRLCTDFFRKHCKFREGEEEKFKIKENIRPCTKKDRPFTGSNSPAGWYILDLEVNESLIEEDWDYGYHGTRAEFVASIMRNGFIKPGGKTATGTLITICPGHIPGKNQIYTSPSMHYAGHYVYALDTEFHYKGDEEDSDEEEKVYYVRAMFMIRQKPGTYRIQGNTIHPLDWNHKVRMDDTFTNDELEWFTEDSNTIVPTSLLLHFSEIPVEKLYEERERVQRAKYPNDVQTTISGSRIFVQRNFNEEKKKKILWVDDYTPNNKELVEMITERGVEVDQCLDTDSAIRKVLEEGPDAYFMAITDMRRTERRENDDVAKEYCEAGLDFIRIVKRYGWKFPVYLYSSYARTRPDIMRAAKEAGAEKICTYDDMKYIIEKDVPDVEEECCCL